MANLIDKLAWVYIKDRKVLGARSTGKDNYYIPGGKREPGETDQQALSREIREELSISLVPESISYFGRFVAQADGKPIGTQVKLSCYRSQYTGRLTADNEIEELAWLSSQDKGRCSTATCLLLDSLKLQELID
ncbi:NUDIX hydrolase [Dongshaea marina]|uniref:NUDIX hydrolase n=1 Tax=Dongshaea marina TaxID=2047966 RepID=UPI000D3E1957|nr:NUDIX domain-containing protein [Dongshaea marina]